MLYYEALQELARERGERLANDGRAERLAHEARARQQMRRRRQALVAGLELLLGARRQAARLRARA